MMRRGNFSLIKPQSNLLVEKITSWMVFGNFQVEHLHLFNNALSIGTNEIPTGLHLGGEAFILWQDNQSKHTLKLCNKCSKDLTLQSINFNPIETLWAHLKAEKTNHSLTSEEDHCQNMLEWLSQYIDNYWTCMCFAQGSS